MRRQQNSDGVIMAWITIKQNTLHSYPSLQHRRGSWQLLNDIGGCPQKTNILTKLGAHNTHRLARHLHRPLADHALYWLKEQWPSFGHPPADHNQGRVK